jgi:hypothetical protein
LQPELRRDLLVCDGLNSSLSLAIDRQVGGAARSKFMYIGGGVLVLILIVLLILLVA